MQQRKQKIISSGDITDYTVDEASQTLYYYVFNDGLYKRKLSDSKAERIYKMVEMKQISASFPLTENIYI